MLFHPKRSSGVTTQKRIHVSYGWLTHLALFLFWLSSFLLLLLCCLCNRWMDARGKASLASKSSNSATAGSASGLRAQTKTRCCSPPTIRSQGGDYPTAGNTLLHLHTVPARTSVRQRYFWTAQSIPGIFLHVLINVQPWHYTHVPLPPGPPAAHKDVTPARTVTLQPFRLQRADWQASNDERQMTAGKAAPSYPFIGGCARQWEPNH